MAASAPPAAPAGNIDDSIVIDKPVREVFEFYRDFQNLPRFLGDVKAIEYTSSDTSRWTILGPLGSQIHWTTKTVDTVQDQQIFYETESESMKTRWHMYFTPGPTDKQTVVREVMFEPGGKLTEAMLALIGKHPAAEVHHNLNRLKEYLETGKVTDMENAVPSKFETS